MAAALYKRTSGIARDARFAPVVPPAPVAKPEPDPRDLEIARLQAECDALQQKLAAAEQRWTKELESLRAAAKKEAADQFERDDAARVRALEAALEAGAAAFRSLLIEGARQLAPRLAQHALGRLVEVRKADADWLLRAIERRLDGLASRTVTGLHVAAGDLSEPILAALAERCGSGVAIQADPSLKAGTARLVLRLGEVVVDPAAGAERLLAALAEGLDDD